MYLQDQLDFSGLYNITIRNVRATNDGVRFNFKILGEEIDVNLTGEKQHFDALRHPRLENKALIKEFQEMNAGKDHIMKCWRHFADFIAECAFSDPLMFEPRYLQGVRSHFENDIFFEKYAKEAEQKRQFEMKKLTRISQVLSQFCPNISKTHKS